ncbi:MAG TPA: hypothetical protein VKP61_13935 [Candidatus Acidoferrum sp.]|nr:hypothetical protein [Candidatus Acidoferrum sp.]
MDFHPAFLKGRKLLFRGPCASTLALSLCGYGYPYPCYYPGYSFGLYSGFGWWGPRFYGHGFYGHRGFRRY